MIDHPALVQRFVAAQLANDRAEALRIIVEDGLHHGGSAIDMQAQVIRIAQHEIGRRWQANEISVAQEHLATTIAKVVMAQLHDLSPPTPRNGRSVVVACVERESHDLPARLVADYLDHAGFAVNYVGTSLTTDALVDLLAVSRPDAVALSVTMTFNLAMLRAAVTRIRNTLATLPIVIGGHAVDWSPGIADELGVVTSEPLPDRVIARVRTLTGLG